MSYEEEDTCYTPVRVGNTDIHRVECEIISLVLCGEALEGVPIVHA